MSGNGNYNRYFRIGHVNSNIFVQWFRTSSSAFTSALFRETFAITEPLLFFDQKSNFGTRTMSKLAKDENPEIKSFRIALFLSHSHTHTHTQTECVTDLD